MAALIASVGRGGKNRPDDVLTVQQLINAKLPIPLAPLSESGICDSQTVYAIEEYQRRNVGMQHPDGRVDPGGQTFRSLTGDTSGGGGGGGSGGSGSSVGPTTGKKYTNNPNEQETRRTTPTPGEVVHMLLATWNELTPNGARTLTAQFMAETGGGKYCFNWNLGNVKASANEPHMYLHGVWEVVGPDSAQTQVDKSGGLAHIATDEEIRKHGWGLPSGKSIVVFEPPHPQCRFRAYSSLQDGAQRWLGHHQGIARKDSTYLTSLNAGDVEAVAHALKMAKYYTAGEADYARAMKRTKADVDRTLGPIDSDSPN